MSEANFGTALLGEGEGVGDKYMKGMLRLGDDVLSLSDDRKLFISFITWGSWCNKELNHGFCMCISMHIMGDGYQHDHNSCPFLTKLAFSIMSILSLQCLTHHAVHVWQESLSRRSNTDVSVEVLVVMFVYYAM